MNIREMIKDLKQRGSIFLTTIYYPFTITYSYFIIIGVLVLEEFRFNNTYSLITFISYHIIAIYTVIFYIRLFPSEEISTKDVMYPEVEEETAHQNLFNIFVTERIKGISNTYRTVCGKCDVFKPPRTHHCSKCDRCYLKMDHHCIFTNNCIGFHNYKFFIIFLYLNCLFTGFVAGNAFAGAIRNVSTKFLVNYIICCVLFVLNCLFTLALLVYHTYLVIHNETICENMAINEYINAGDVTPRITAFQEGPLSRPGSDIIEGDRLIIDRRLLNPYNIGAKQNFLEVFGDNPLYWFLPTFSSRGNGLNFIKNSRNVSGEHLLDIF